MLLSQQQLATGDWQRATSNQWQQFAAVSAIKVVTIII